MKRTVFRPLGVAVLLLGAALLADALGIRICTSESMPLGLYLERDRPAEPGALVLACLPRPWAELAFERGYVGRGPCPAGTEPIGKAVLAAGGASLFFAPDGVRLGGPRGALVAGSAPRHQDALGRPLPHPPFGIVQLSSDALWLHSPHHPASFDSRYFGPVPASAVVAVLSPLWVAGDFRMRKSGPGAN